MPLGRALAAAFCTLVLFCLPLTATALDGVTVVLSEDGGVYAQVADRLRTTLSQASGATKPSVKVVTLQSLKEGETLPTSTAQLLVTVGTGAMQAMAQKPQSAPILNLLVPRQSFEKAARQNGRNGDTRAFSAIYLDQPWDRQFSLMRHTMPGKTRVGILLGPDSTELAAPLRAAAKAAGLVAIIETVLGEAELVPSLKRLLADCDMLLAVPDPLIFNKHTVQSILITAYRQQIPLFGFSPSYVKAGALAAVYSLPEQIGQQAAETILRLNKDKNLPSPQPPRFFMVGTNTQVARSLGLDLIDEAILSSKLKHELESRQ